jgi:hypothetical protein
MRHATWKGNERAPSARAMWGGANCR